MVVKKWELKKQVSDSLEEQLLYCYGVDSVKKEEFFNPNYEKDLHDPFKILNMDKAVERILKAIKDNEKILLYGDYDADGICGAIVFHDFFKKIGFENFDTYIPDRHKDGYGLTLECIDEFEKQKVNLIITIDCGITDVEETEKANEKGIDVVVTDHHLQGEKLPPAVAIINSKQKKDKYPFKMLCGAAVAFKTVNAIIEKGDFNIVEGWSKWLLDVVCIATIADMVPLADENRAIVFYGLQVLRKTKRPGLLALFKKLKINQKNIKEDDIAFFVAPRINTAGRMGSAGMSFELLSTESLEEAEWTAERLDQKNGERRELVGSIVDEVEKLIADQPQVPEFLCFGNEDWEPGVLGIAANRVLENYNKPVVLWGKGGGLYTKGSGRSNGSVNLIELMNFLGEDFFSDYGGHVLSAGFTMKGDKTDGLSDAFQKVIKKVKSGKVEDVIMIDKEVALDEINWNFLKVIEKFEPFGMDYPKPVFLIKNLEVSNVKMFGNGGIHLQLDFKRNSGKVISAIAFFMKNEGRLEVKSGDKIDLLASVEKSTFKGYNELRLKIVDFKVL